MIGKLKVLVVDSEEPFRRILALRVKRLTAVAPREAVSAEAAWCQIQRAQPDVIIADTTSGLMSGLDLIYLVHKHYPRIRIISLFSGLTGCSITEDDLRRMGATSVLRKHEMSDRLVPELKSAVLGLGLMRVLSSIFSGTV